MQFPVRPNDCRGRCVRLRGSQMVAEGVEHALLVQGGRNNVLAIREGVLASDAQVLLGEMGVGYRSVNEPQERSIAARNGGDSCNEQAADSQATYQSLLH